jgi:ferric-dicitrate binding protein FerR (iron transport regulator)
VPPQAEGFVVLSPNFELVDSGTEFGVQVAEDGSGNVRVYEGRVELYEPGTGRSAKTRREVLADENVSVNDIRRITINTAQITSRHSGSRVCMTAGNR